MKRIQMITVLLAVVVGSIATAMTGCTGSSRNDKATQSGAQSGQKDGTTVRYTCSMHPEVVQDKAGDCPKCGMKLVQKN